MENAVLRILDAAANRAREGLRVLEDCARFSLNDAGLTESLKHLRHDLAAALALLPMEQALQTRDTQGDVGTDIKTAAELHRESWPDLLAANAKRLSEALRSLEEAAKTINPDAAQALERLRYRGYTLEKSLLGGAAGFQSVERFSRVRLYVLLTESICAPGRSWEGVLEEILAAAPAHAGISPLCVQLREKSCSDAELLARARVLVNACRKAGALAIINDRIDIALLSGADGVHLGQTDLPCGEVRRLLGPGKIIGVSTEKIAQAWQAVADGATYIAAGPMFPTTTKEKPRIAGPDYAAELIAANPPLNRPIVAIGGITLQHVQELTSRGIRSIAVSSAILRAQDAGLVVRNFLDRLELPGPKV